MKVLLKFLIGHKKITAIGLLTAGFVGLLILRLYFEKTFAVFFWLHGLLFFVSLAMVALGTFVFSLSIFRISQPTSLNLMLLLMAIFFVLAASEIYLRYAGINQTYMERRNGKYISAYIKHDSNVNRTYVPGTDAFLQSGEFKYPRHHNNYGFSDFDFYAKKDTSKILIQTYGDSFTEGDGAPFDSSYPAILQTILKKNGQQQFEIQNFGICGNDPAFYYEQMKNIGIHFKPDVAIIVYGTLDFNTDFFCRGGLERFKNGYWQGYSAPNWEWVYAASYIFRLVLHSLTKIKSVYFLTTEQHHQTRLQALRQKWNSTFIQIADIARQANVKVLLIKKPERGEIGTNRYDYDFNFFEHSAEVVKDFKQFDLLPYFRDSIHINQNNSLTYFWPQDGHANATGYAAMAKGVYTGLKKSYPEIFTNLASQKRERE